MQGRNDTLLVEENRAKIRYWYLIINFRISAKN